MHLLWQALFGLVVGAIAKLIMPGRDPGGILITMLLGVVGSLVGTFIGRALWGGENYSAGWITPILGAIILLAIYRAVKGRQAAQGARARSGAPGIGRCERALRPGSAVHVGRTARTTRSSWAPFPGRSEPGTGCAPRRCHGRTQAPPDGPASMRFLMAW